MLLLITCLLAAALPLLITRCQRYAALFSPLLMFSAAAAAAAAMLTR